MSVLILNIRWPEYAPSCQIASAENFQPSLDSFVLKALILSDNSDRQNQSSVLEPQSCIVSWGPRSALIHMYVLLYLYTVRDTCQYHMIFEKLHVQWVLSGQRSNATFLHLAAFVPPWTNRSFVLLPSRTHLPLVLSSYLLLNFYLISKDLVPLAKPVREEELGNLRQATMTVKNCHETLMAGHSVWCVHPHG